MNVPFHVTSTAELHHRALDGFFAFVQRPSYLVKKPERYVLA